MKLIVGLGNPGEKYSGNRHNIGFMAVDEIARGYGFAPWKKRFQGYTAEGQIGLEKCILLKPSTYMNESGRAVGEAMRFYKLPLGDVIVIHDEIDLKPGAIRVKKGGGNAGHNGLKSISAHAGNDYVRVRLGIDHPGDKALVANYVLQDFAKSDCDWLLPLLEGVARGMAKLVDGSEAAFLAEAAVAESVQLRRLKQTGPRLCPTAKSSSWRLKRPLSGKKKRSRKRRSRRKPPSRSSTAPLPPPPVRLSCFGRIIIIGPPPMRSSCFGCKPRSLSSRVLRKTVRRRRRPFARRGGFLSLALKRYPPCQKRHLRGTSSQGGFERAFAAGRSSRQRESRNISWASNVASLDCRMSVNPPFSTR